MVTPPGFEPGMVYCPERSDGATAGAAGTRGRSEVRGDEKGNPCGLPFLVTPPGFEPG